jgi:hypothetical protein
MTPLEWFLLGSLLWVGCGALAWWLVIRSYRLDSRDHAFMLAPCMAGGLVMLLIVLLML